MIINLNMDQVIELFLNPVLIKKQEKATFHYTLKLRNLHDSPRLSLLSNSLLPRTPIKILRFQSFSLPLFLLKISLLRGTFPSYSGLVEKKIFKPSHVASYLWDHSYQVLLHLTGEIMYNSSKQENHGVLPLMIKRCNQF